MFSIQARELALITLYQPFQRLTSISIFLGARSEYYRLANTQVAGTYLFVSETEKNSALAQFPSLFVNEEVAFEVG